MSGAAEILVIVLSIILAIFLVLAIVLVALLIKVTRQIKKVAETAGRTANSVETAIAGFAKVTSSAFIMKQITKQFNKFKNRK